MRGIGGRLCARAQLCERSKALLSTYEDRYIIAQKRDTYVGIVAFYSLVLCSQNEDIMTDGRSCKEYIIVLLLAIILLSLTRSNVIIHTL